MFDVAGECRFFSCLSSRAPAKICINTDPVLLSNRRCTTLPLPGRSGRSAEPHTHAPPPFPIPFPVFSQGSVLSLVEDKETEVKKGESQKFGFTMRFMQMTQFVERSWYTESEEERKEWMDSYEQVQRDLSAQAAVQGATDVSFSCVLMYDRPHSL